MNLEQIILLALIQGITEFLPISSSGHLALMPLLTEWPDQGLLNDIALHFGTLLAVMIYFWRDVKSLFIGLFDTFGNNDTMERKLFILLVVASIPVFIVGFILQQSGLIDLLRNLEVIAWANIIFAVALYVCDKYGRLEKTVDHLNMKTAFYLGLSQVLALIPGASRSGTTMTMGRLLGMKRDEAARFSMLMSIPTILAASSLLLLKLSKVEVIEPDNDMFLLIGLSFAVAFFAIWGLMAMLKRMSMTPFVIYRLVLGAGIIAYIYF